MAFMVEGGVCHLAPFEYEYEYEHENENENEFCNKRLSYFGPSSPALKSGGVLASSCCLPGGTMK